MSDPEGLTNRRVPAHALQLPLGLELMVVAGPDRGRSLPLEPGKTYSVGKDPACDLLLSDPDVSRRHLELVVHADRIAVRDLGSTNGSFYGGVRFDRIHAGPGAALTLGSTEMRIVAPDSAGAVQQFGQLLGRSPSMRDLFTMARRAAASDTPVLIQGETGTGKELLAAAIHEASPLADKPFVICDLAGIPRTLIESELFGHVRGAFTGAERNRSGAFTEANGGTLFLDEIGELDLELQPRLLRVLESGQVKQVGKSTYDAVDVRVVAATNRDLEEEVSAGRFRRDLYHRLAVVRLELQPLRSRPDDIPLLVEHFLTASGPEVSQATMAALRSYEWPGNVRELRNVLERAITLAPEARVLDAGIIGLPEAAATAPSGHDLTFRQAKGALIDHWEREYISELLRRADGNVSEAARRGGMGRVSLHRLLRKHGLGGSGT